MEEGRGEAAIRGAPPCLPPVVDVDELVAEGGEACRHKRVGGAADQVLVNIRVVGVPGVPAHRWHGEQ